MPDQRQPYVAGPPAAPSPPVISVMLIVPEAEAAVEWYRCPIQARR